MWFFSKLWRYIKSLFTKVEEDLIIETKEYAKEVVMRVKNDKALQKKLKNLPDLIKSDRKREAAKELLKEDLINRGYQPQTLTGFILGIIIDLAWKELRLGKYL